MLLMYNEGLNNFWFFCVCGHRTEPKPTLEAAGREADLHMALVAAAAVGAVSDLASSARAWVRLGPAVRPTGKHRALHRARAARYSVLLEALAAVSRDPEPTPQEIAP